MRNQRVQPSEASQNLVLSVDKFSWPLALEGFCAIQTYRMAQNRISCNAAITCCEKSSTWNFALDLLHSFGKHQRKSSDAEAAAQGPDTVTVSAAISACEKGGQWTLALLLLHSVRFFEQKPNEISFNAAISASEKFSKWQRSASLLHALLEILRPTAITYNAVISACHRAQELLSY